jgi:hypothetical protein
MTRRKHHTRAIRNALIVWAGIIVIASAETIFRALGWITITAIIAAGSYYAGRRNMLAQASRHVRTRKLAANASYGKTRAYRGGSLPREPVKTVDAVSPYPPGMTGDTLSRLLRHPLSGVRRLSTGDDD